MSRARVDNDFYDALGARWTEDPSHAIALLVAEAPAKLAYVRRAVGPAPQRIIDIGCGAGLLAMPLAVDGHTVRAVDRSAPSLEVGRGAARRAGAPVSFDRQDALALGEPDGTFDVALLLDIIEHVEDPARLVAEAVRVVRPGGIVVFHTFTRNPVAYLVAVLGPIEVLRQAQIDTSSSFNYTPYVGAALIFIALTIPMTRFADWIQARSRSRRRAGGAS